MAEFGQTDWPAALNSRFDPIAVIGSGGMGTVWKALDRRSGEAIAVKVVNRVDEGAQLARRRLLREARAIGRIRHPNVVRIRDFLEWGGEMPVIAMELVEGRALSTFRRTWLPWSELGPVLVQVLAGLACAHSRGVIHRDLKPENVLVAPGPAGGMVVKITDFGLARLAEVDPRKRTASLTGVALAGTAPYVAPEQLVAGASLSPLADIFAFGVLAYEFLSGTLPWDADDSAEGLTRRIREPPRPLAIRDEIGAPHGIAELVLRCLARTPIARYAMAADVRRALSSLVRRATGGFPTVGTSPGPMAHTLASAGAELPDFDGPPTSPRMMSEGAPGLELAVIDLLDVETPLVGRKGIESILTDSMRLVARTGIPNAMILTGPSGIGKTRLLEWARERTVESGVMLPVVMDGSAGDTDASLSAAISDALGWRRDVAQEQPAWFREGLAALGISDSALVRRIARIWSGPGGAGSGEYPPRGERWEAFGRILAGLARIRPVLLLIDGLGAGRHEEVIHFLEWLVTDTGMSGVPILGVGALRTEESMGGTDDVERSGVWDVSPVAYVDVPALDTGSIEAILATAGAPAARSAAIASIAQGNPLVAREWARAPDSELTHAASASGVAEKLAVLLRARVRQLPVSPDRRESLVRLLRGLSLGPPFPDFEMISSAVGRAWPDLGETPLQSLLWTAVGNGLLSERGSSIGEVDFLHMAWREAMHADAVQQPDAPEWHRAWEAALREREPTPELLRNIGVQRLALGDPGGAALALLESAETAAAEGYLELAEHSFRDALDLSPVAHGAPELRREERARARLGLLEIESTLGRWNEAIEKATELLAEPPGSDPTIALAHWLRAVAHRRCGHSRRALTDFREAAARFSALAEPARIAGCHVEIAGILTDAGRLADAGEELRAALRATEQTADARLEADVLAALGLVESRGGNHNSAQELMAKAIEFATGSHDPAVLYRALTASGAVERAADRLDRAQELHLSAHALARERGDFLAIQHERLYLAEIALRRGNAEAAEHFLNACRSQVRPSQWRSVELGLATLTAELALARGDFDAGIAGIQRAIALDEGHAGVGTEFIDALRRCMARLAESGRIEPLIEARLQRG